MTNTPDRQPPSLKVVPPQKIKSPGAETPKSPNPPAQEAMAVPEKKGINWGRIVLLLGLIGGGFWLSQMEVSTSVRGNAKLQILEENSEVIYMEEPGRVVNFMVKHGDKVQPGTRLAQVESADLEDEILAEQRKLEEEQAKLTSAREKILILTTKKTSAEQLVRSAQHRVEMVQDDVTRLSSSSPPPEIQRITHEIESMDSQIMGIKTAMIHREDRVKQIEDKIVESSNAVKEGALSENYHTDLERELSMAIEELDRSQSEIEQLNNQKEARRSEIDLTGQRLERDLNHLQGELRYEEANLATVEQELRAAQAEKLDQMAIVETSGNKIAQLQSKRLENRELESQIVGIVLGQNLSENRGKWLERHDPVLQIANIDQLEAEISFNQADADLIQAIVDRGSTMVELKPIQPGYDNKMVEVRDIEKVSQLDPAQQTQQVVLKATVDNSEGQWLINNEFFAEIVVEEMPLYERVRRELMKVLKLRQF